MSPDIKDKRFSEVIRGETPVLVDFYADWCAPCRMMPPILKELKKRMGDSLHILKIDTEKNADLAIRYQVRGIPTLLLFKEGRVIWQQSGVMQAPQLEEVIRRELEDYETKMGA
ncbi:thioredoxin [Balneolales bacterium ANBcel1]|nr:thioredoxin [Balneolales bacterium ANBcel1]